MIKRECIEKSVLDVGCVAKSTGGWLHSEICEVSKRGVGVDIQEELVRELGKIGYEVICANAEDFRLGEKFDTVVLGELIEHVSNPGLVLDRCREHLSNRGRLVVSSPNPFNPGIFRKYELSNVETDHVIYHSPAMFKRLVGRH